MMRIGLPPSTPSPEMAALKERMSAFQQGSTTLTKDQLKADLDTLKQATGRQAPPLLQRLVEQFDKVAGEDQELSHEEFKAFMKAQGGPPPGMLPPPGDEPEGPPEGWTGTVRNNPNEAGRRFSGPTGRPSQGNLQQLSQYMQSTADLLEETLSTSTRSIRV